MGYKKEPTLSAFFRSPEPYPSQLNIFLALGGIRAKTSSKIACPKAPPLTTKEVIGLSVQAGLGILFVTISFVVFSSSLGGDATLKLDPAELGNETAPAVFVDDPSLSPFIDVTLLLDEDEDNFDFANAGKSAAECVLPGIETPRSLKPHDDDDDDDDLAVSFKEACFTACESCAVSY